MSPKNVIDIEKNALTDFPDDDEVNFEARHMKNKANFEPVSRELQK